MESNDNGSFPEARNWEPHFQHGDLLGEAVKRKFERDSEDLWEKRFLWLTTDS